MKFDDIIKQQKDELKEAIIPGTTTGQQANPAATANMAAASQGVDLSILDKAKGVDIQKAIQKILPNDLKSQQTIINGLVQALNPQKSTQTQAQATPSTTPTAAVPASTVGQPQTTTQVA